MSAALSSAPPSADSIHPGDGTSLTLRKAEAGVVAEAERSFDAWWKSIDPVERMRLDGFDLWRSYKAGWLSMARELGHLPVGRAA